MSGDPSNKESTSVIDEVRAVRRRVARRLAELEPLVREYEELLEVAGELGIDTESGAQSEVAPAKGAAPPHRKAGPRGGTQRSAPAALRPDNDRSRHVVEAVRARPGATVAEVATTLEAPAKSLYRPVRELTSSGALIKRGRQLFPGPG